MDIKSLKAISPLDGRYCDKVKPLTEYLSESALIFYRLEIEIKYLIALSKINIVRKLSLKEIKILTAIYTNKSDEKLLMIKGFEDSVKHDVKSIELFLREVLKDTTLTDIIEKLHYCLTSEDINNMAYRMMLRDSINKCILPQYKELILKLKAISVDNKNLVILARTHGQDAIPTTFGKELMVFAVRLYKIYENISSFKLTGKLNGAIGAWNAHEYAESDTDWLNFSKKFITAFGFESNQYSTQINQYDDVVGILSLFHLFNGVMLNFNQDMWRYISDGWLAQKVNKNQVGSSTMAQKVNPINFENSEGNAIIANGLIEALMRALPISRLQRDLSNSTVIRNISTIMGHELLIIKSTTAGVDTIQPNAIEINKYLNSNWSILAEPLQIILRKYNIDNAFNIVKDKMMGKKLSKKEWLKLIEKLDVTMKIKNEMKKLSPQKYIGYCSRIVEEGAKLINF